MPLFPNVGMENGPFIDDFPIKTSIYEGFSMAMLDNYVIPSGKHTGMSENGVYSQ